MLAHRRFVGRLVHAVDAVVGDVAVDPLDLRPHAAEHPARFLRDGLEVRRGELAGAGNVSFDHELGHGCSPWVLAFQKLSVAAPDLINSCMALAPWMVTPSTKSSCT